MKPCKHPQYNSECRVCYLYENDPRYKKLMDNPPSIVTKVINFTGAMYESAKTGFKKVPLEAFNQRKEHCDKCELNVEGVCTHPKCGCPLSKRLLSVLGVPGKLDLASEKCPLGFWGRVDHAS